MQPILRSTDGSGAWRLERTSASSRQPTAEPSSFVSEDVGSQLAVQLCEEPIRRVVSEITSRLRTNPLRRGSRRRLLSNWRGLPQSGDADKQARSHRSAGCLGGGGSCPCHAPPPPRKRCPAARQSPSEPISNGAITAAKVDLSLSPGALQPSALHNAQAVPLLSGARPGMRFVPALVHRNPRCSHDTLNKLCHQEFSGPRVSELGMGVPDIRGSQVHW